MAVPPSHVRTLTGLPGGQLLGRPREREVLDRLLTAASGGEGGVLVVHGEPGVGKTALLDWATDSRDEFRVLRTAGVEGEMELPFAALQQLCAPILGLMERLPPPQRDAVAVAFGLKDGQAPNPFLVGLAVLGLLSEAAEERPLLCVVDDAQWLDRASARALAFVARRLLAERVTVLLAARELGGALTGLPELSVEPLAQREARALLESVLAARVDEAVLDRIVVETRGNPLALIELPRGLTPTQLAGGFGLPPVPLSASIEESYSRRLAVLPDDARRFLLVAAAEPTGDLALVWRAARALGLSEAAAQSVESEALIALDGGVAFRHPLVRSAVYRASGVAERSEVHRALAEATDPDLDPDRRAWHRAQAASMPDEDVAAELERSAGRAHARGGLAAAAAFLERSSALTLDPARRASRALAAAQAKQEAGAFDEALTLAAHAETGPLGELERAQVDVLRARISFAADRGSAAPPLLLAAAKRLESLDVSFAREIYLDALTAAIFAGRLGAPPDARQVADAVRDAPPAPAPPRAADLLLDGLALVITEGHAAGTRGLQEALSAFHSDELGTEEGLRWRWLAGRTAGYVWDHEGWDALTTRQIRAAREVGALAHLPLAFSTRVGVHLFAGDLHAAASLVEQANSLADVTDGRIVPPYNALALAAFRGREDELTRLKETTTEDFKARGEGLGLTLSEWVTAVLYNGRGRYEDALAAAVQAAADPRELWFGTFALVELIEAASRSDRGDLAAEALAALSECTSASGTPWALGVESRSRALLAQADAAETLYRQAIDGLQPTRLRFDLARSHLLYGEWLRRERRRIDARNELRVAHELFSDFGMEAFAERARIELQATGARARKRTVDTLDELTPQEAEVARLAARGDTNREIAAQLFISTNTVEYHLHKVFRKLNVRSRTQLARRMS